MKKDQDSLRADSFVPVSEIMLVLELECKVLSASHISIDTVGEKAYGLSCLPDPWTLPYIVVDGGFYEEYLNNKGDKDSSWIRSIVSALKSKNINENDAIIVRSSGKYEGLDRRGSMYSYDGYVYNIRQCIFRCFDEMNEDDDIIDNKIPIIIQKRVEPISKKGHLSNERRIYKEKRDWLGEIEQYDSKSESVINVNLRNWRKKVDLEAGVLSKLKCNLSAHISNVLRYPATWATNKNVRVHYEWVWDGECVYLVQADKEKPIVGINPKKINIPNRSERVEGLLCLRLIDEGFEGYSKLENALLYRKKGLCEIPIFVLDDIGVLDDLANGKLNERLVSDIKALVKGSLVIRMDIESKDLTKRQMLPRTQEVREYGEALLWLQKQSRMARDNFNEKVIFIFHNFIPAVSSAFAYAEPSQRKVQIEALWGLPEGLYFNSHDKYIVDTCSSKVNEDLNSSRDDYVIKKDINYKHYFVKPSVSGEWRTEIVSVPYDWSPTIKNDNIVKKIAQYSRIIAEAEGGAVSIMWFIEVPEKIYSSDVLPWYHERCDIRISKRARPDRKKKIFDKSYIIEKESDVTALENEVVNGEYSIKSVRIEPREAGLIRDKDTLKRIGEICKKLGATIFMEGGVLSHAYYQLMQVKAVVEVVYPFEERDDVHVYNKIVRDKIPEKIHDGGEKVNCIYVEGEQLVKELKNKLVEESFEVLDAIDQDDIISELADVQEVLNSLIEQLGCSRNEIESARKRKKERAGGFDKGIMLIKTKNITPTSQIEEDAQADLFDNDNVGVIVEAVPSDKYVSMARRINKWTDKQELGNINRSIMKLKVPYLLDDWGERSQEIKVEKNSGGVVVDVKGKRKKSNLEIEVSLLIRESHNELESRQLSLFR